jgi:plasmid stabilization system protein ParE
MKVFFAPAAKLDLLSIGEHIGRENPTRAVSFVDELIDHCYTLADLPRRYPLVPRYEHWGIRRSVYGNYLIFYRVREDAVDIVHVLHGAMDYESMLFPDA